MADLKIPAPDAPAEEWGRLAVSIPGFAWAPGMRQSQPGGPGFAIYVGTVGGGTAAWHGFHGWGGYDDEGVDPDDPATAGCLLALLGEWNGYAREKYVYSNGRVTPYRAVVRSCVDGITHESTSLGRACIAAAAALGRWPGGTP